MQKGMWSQDAFERQNALIARLGIPKGVPDLKVDEVLERMMSDKKARDGIIRFVLPERIGKIVPRDDVAHEEIVAGIQYMQHQALG